MPPEARGRATHQEQQWPEGHSQGDLSGAGRESMGKVSGPFLSSPRRLPGFPIGRTQPEPHHPGLAPGTERGGGSGGTWGAAGEREAHRAPQADGSWAPLALSSASSFSFHRHPGRGVDFASVTTRSAEPGCQDLVHTGRREWGSRRVRVYLTSKETGILLALFSGS